MSSSPGLDVIQLERQSLDAAEPKCVVCTVADGSYMLGAAGVLNSLVAANFSGEYVIGYRGEPPQWWSQLEATDRSDRRKLSESIFVTLRNIRDDWHPSNTKPFLIRELMSELSHEDSSVFYIDTDIVVTCQWSVLLGWTKFGVLLCADAADSSMAPDHVFRHAWADLAAKAGYAATRSVTGYYNAGFIGLRKRHERFLATWCDLMRALETAGAPMVKMKVYDIRIEWSRMDQDMLNAAVMASDAPLATLGPQAMGMFPWVGEILPHAMFHEKPWTRNYVWSALRGFAPSHADVAYWKYVDGPIRPFGRAALLRKKFLFKTARLIGLLHKRGLNDL